MRLRRADQGPKAKPRATRRPVAKRRLGLGTFWLLNLVAVAAILMLAFAVGLRAWMDKADEYSARYLGSTAAVLVQELGGRAAALQGRLREWGADPALQSALQDPDPGRLEAIAEGLTRQIPDALWVRVFKPDGGKGGGRTPALSFAGLDLVHQAERERRVTALEVHRLGSDEVHLAIAAPVLDARGGQLLGVVHLALPLSLLPPASAAGGEWGSVFYQQRVGDQVAFLDPTRAKSPPRGEPVKVAEVPGTRLQVAAWIERDSLVESDLLRYGALGLLLVLALIGGALYLNLVLVRRALAADHAAVVSLVEDGVNRRPARPRLARLSDVQPLFDVLASLVYRLAPASGETGELAAVPSEGPATGAGLVPPTSKAVGLEVGPLEEIAHAPIAVPASVFRAYDIRGRVDGDLTVELVRSLGRAVALEADEVGDQTVLVARDTRPSGEALSQALVEGLCASGRDVIDLGVVPTPVLYFAASYQGGKSGVMITGSHNPPEYNGLKVVVDGEALGGERIGRLRERILKGEFLRGEGHVRHQELIEVYLGAITGGVAIARTLKVVIDCGNGTAALVAPRLYRALGCQVIELNCDPAAGFPDGRVPDPARPECLQALQARVLAEGGDLGLAFDGDADRLGVVDSAGKIIWPDRVLMLLAADVLSRQPGSDIVFDVKSSHHLAAEIQRSGGCPVMWKSGHSPLKAKLRETGAPLAGEWSGHIVFAERWYGFDDALYAGARLLEVLALDPRTSAEVFAALPESPISTPELAVPLDEGEPARIMGSILALADRLDGVQVTTVDGLRVEFDRGWGLVRASNTQPALLFRFEADDEEALGRLQALFTRLLDRAAPGLELPF